jgi:hypothetical protein
MKIKRSNLANTVRTLMTVSLLAGACADSAEVVDPEPDARPPEGKVIRESEPDEGPAIKPAPSSTDPEPATTVVIDDVVSEPVKPATVPEPPPVPPTKPVVVPPKPDAQLELRQVTLHGGGCSAWTWRDEPSPSGPIALNLIGYAAQAGGNERTLEVKSCTISLDLGADKNLSYAVKSVTYRGHAALGADATAKLHMDYAFPGEPSLIVGGSREFGPNLKQDYVFVHEIDPAHAVWSPCGVDRDLHLRTHIRVRSDDAAVSSFSLTGVSALDLFVRGCDAASADAGTPAPSKDGPAIVSVTRR